MINTLFLSDMTLSRYLSWSLSRIWWRMTAAPRVCFEGLRAAAEWEKFVFSWDLNSIFLFSWWPLHQWGFCSVLLLEQQFAKWWWSHLRSYWNNKKVLYWSSRSLRLWLKDTTLYNEGASVSKMQIEIQVKSMWSLLQAIKRLKIHNISVSQLCWWYPDLPSLISKRL